MKKTVIMLFTVACVLLLFVLGSLCADKQILCDNIIRLHVIANSDDPKDQEEKLLVRDAVFGYLTERLAYSKDITDAYKIVKNELDALTDVANAVLLSVKSKNCARVSLRREAYDIRTYDTFKLPSGVYESLRIQIGAGDGANWWCVVFPTFCVQSTVEQFQSVAVSSGFSDDLVGALSIDESTNIRFFVLDCIGKIENFLLKR